MGARLFVVGSGKRVFREYALRAIAKHADIVLVNDELPDWIRKYCDEFVCVDLSDNEKVLDAVSAVKADGLLTYDERYVELAAQVAERRGFAGPGTEPVRVVKDKKVLRSKLTAAGVGPVKFAVANTRAEAYAAVERVGLPAVFKPRALGGSAGVRLVADHADVAGAFDEATTARVGTTASRYAGILVEEYVDGPEFSVDSVTAGGVTMPLVIAEKQTGLAPYFEEMGHIVPQEPGVLPQEALELVCHAHAIAGLDNLVSHSEVRIGAKGPRLIEVNARLGGDLIPYLGLLAQGVDLAGAAAMIALGSQPTIKVEDLGAAAVRFIYPTCDIRYESSALQQAPSAYPGLEVFEPIVQPGKEMLLPPRGYMSRLAVLVASAPSRAECMRNLESATADLIVRGTRLDAGCRG